MAFCMTLLSIFDIPVFWPILLIYFIILMVRAAQLRLAGSGMTLVLSILEGRGTGDVLRHETGASVAITIPSAP